MPNLPTTGLDTLPLGDHPDHHEELHAYHNVAVASASATGIGATTTRTAAADAASSHQSIQRHFVLPEQAITHVHSTAGPLAFAVTAPIRAVKITASQNITGLTVAGIELGGAEFSTIFCLLEATAAITIDMSSGAIVVGDAPATLAIGETVPFQIQRWNL